MFLKIKSIMNKIITCLLLFWSSQELYSQQVAITDKGETVLLYDDGTWSYQETDIETESEIPLNPTVFEKPDSATFLLKSNKTNIGFWLDPKKWKFTKGANNSDAEYEIKLKNEDLYAMIISERTSIPIESMRAIALENGREAAPNLKIIKEEYRNINGLKVLFLQMNGTLQGIDFTYYGYYYSNENGTIQFITYTAQNLLETYAESSEELLNGLVELNP